MAPEPQLWESGITNPHAVNQARDSSEDPTCNEISTMDMNDITEFLHSAARSVGAEVTSPWFYLQLGLILASAGIAIAARAVIRAPIDTTSLAMSWPPALRLFTRVLIGSISTAVFALVMIVAR